jgi:hypothetical protein
MGQSSSYTRLEQNLDRDIQDSGFGAKIYLFVKYTLGLLVFRGGKRTVQWPSMMNTPHEGSMMSIKPIELSIFTRAKICNTIPGAVIDVNMV